MPEHRLINPIALLQFSVSSRDLFRQMAVDWQGYPMHIVAISDRPWNPSKPSHKDLLLGDAVLEL